LQDQLPTNSVDNLNLRPASSTTILRNSILNVGYDNDSLVPATSLPDLPEHSVFPRIQYLQVNLSTLIVLLNQSMPILKIYFYYVQTLKRH
jgi:hypothetical protein